MFVNLMVRLLGEELKVFVNLVFFFFFFVELEFHIFPCVLFLHVKLPPLGT